MNSDNRSNTAPSLNLLKVSRYVWLLPNSIPWSWFETSMESVTDNCKNPWPCNCLKHAVGAGFFGTRLEPIDPRQIPWMVAFISQMITMIMLQSLRKEMISDYGYSWNATIATAYDQWRWWETTYHQYVLERAFRMYNILGTWSKYVVPKRSWYLQVFHCGLS